jgi:hypothetical protein
MTRSTEPNVRGFWSQLLKKDSATISSNIQTPSANRFAEFIFPPCDHGLLHEKNGRNAKRPSKWDRVADWRLKSLVLPYSSVLIA